MVIMAVAARLTFVPYWVPLKETQRLCPRPPPYPSCWTCLPLCCERRVMGCPLEPNKSRPSAVTTRSYRAATIWTTSLQGGLPLHRSCYRSHNFPSHSLWQPQLPFFTFTTYFTPTPPHLPSLLIHLLQVNNSHRSVPGPAAGGLTFVVHVGGHLHHAEAQIDRQVVEMVVGLQDELSSQLHVIAFLVHFIDQHSIEVFILEKSCGCDMLRYAFYIKIFNF